MKNGEKIFLIGFMGSGKTTVGKKLAILMEYDFLDTDAEIERLEGSSISDIFANQGEHFFREKEQALLLQLNEKDRLIISTGGGMPCFSNNMEWMNCHGITVYLKATPAMIEKRLKQAKMQRPLLKSVPQESLRETIATMLQQRDPYYCRAHLILNALNINAKDIAKALNNFQKL